MNATIKNKSRATPPLNVNRQIRDAKVVLRDLRQTLEEFLVIAT